MANSIFEIFGRDIYYCQCIEQGVINLCMYKYQKSGITKARYDELYGRYQQETFGVIKQELVDLNFLKETLLEKLDEFHKIRNYLAHNFFYDNAIQYDNEELHPALIQELEEIFVFLNELNNRIMIELDCRYAQMGYDINDIMAIGYDILINKKIGKKIVNSRKITKNENVVDLFDYKIADQISVLILQLGDHSFWTLCESGFTQIDFEIEKENIEKIIRLEGLLPLNGINLKPKVKEHWDFTVDLKKRRLLLVVSKDKTCNKIYWTIKKSI